MCRVSNSDACMHICTSRLPGHSTGDPYIRSSVSPPGRIRHHTAPEAVRNGDQGPGPPWILTGSL